MRNEQTSGMLYELLIKWIYENNQKANPYIEGQDVSAHQMLELINAERTLESPDLIDKRMQVVANQMLLAFSVLYQTNLYESKRRWIADLITKTIKAESSEKLVSILDQVVAEVYFGDN
ncbi:hypothetical protein QNI19_02930 [Cytophagaceae bacterium DM2B3-1]|uniref:Uncharacterized protein n=1 Tax=Xanthocytophaga flava TaxID=3048013 RepID=A0ABT7CFV1_9BACT|nr:hypothetical protein [Xanthocytophaga flavus]MDJ1472690.1 hypothetical protein [Xanthocytophaga flavus]MDJ1491870.1 hypothetical protein [Xanthocytophaga flavus]